MDKRRYIRYSATGSVIIKSHKEGLKADLIDISFLGICIHTKEKIEPNAEIKFNLVTKFQSKPIEAEGRAKYVTKIGSGFKAGIEFIRIDKATLEAILNNIQCANAREKRKKAELRREHSQSGDFEYF